MPPDIHSTAIVDSSAKIGDNCTIGPYCMIGENVSLGDNSNLHSHVVLDGDLTIGEHAEIFPFACIGKQTQDLKFQGDAGDIRIGSNVTIREYVTVNSPTSGEGSTTVGDDCHILAYCHIAHDCRVGNNVVMSNATNLAGHVIVDDHVVFGGLVGVHQFCRIGTMAMIGTHSKIVQDIAPYSLAEGNPAFPKTVNKVGMERNGINADDIRKVSAAHKKLFRSGLTQEQALTEIKEELGETEELTSLITFVQDSERGLARPRHKTNQ